MKATVFEGDCLEWVTLFEDNYFDSIVTDPPYGLSFMGKDWDHGVPGTHFWKEFLRVAKPGAHLLAFGGTRTHHRLMVAIEDAGWEIRDTLMWVYGSGFPKSLDVSKAIDNHEGKQMGWFGEWLRKWRKENNIPQKEIAKLFPSKTGGITGCVANWELGFNIPTIEQFNLIRDTFNLPFEYLEDIEREVIGQRKTGIGTGKGSTPIMGDGNRDITTPRTDAAKQWSGWGTALKPAYEIIILARKPLDGTVANNVLTWGCGGINVDGCRVALNGDKPRIANTEESKTNTYGWAEGGGLYKSGTMPETGRFPANLIHDGSDEVLALFPQSKGQLAKVGPENGNKDSVNVFGDYGPRQDFKPRGDSGSAARFFYCAKASKSERNIGCENLQLKTAGECTDRQEDTAGLNSPRAGAGRTNGSRNHHPTVKPLALLQYLCRLITPLNGIILDPFAGSGSTGLAATREGFNSVLIEIDRGYCEIARARNSVT